MNIKNDIRIKSIGFLIDQLGTNNMRCFAAQDRIMDTSLSEEERLQAAIWAQELNATRSALIKAIDDYFGQGDISMGGNKTYTYFVKQEQEEAARPCKGGKKKGKKKKKS